MNRARGQAPQVAALALLAGLVFTAPAAAQSRRSAGGDPQVQFPSKQLQQVHPAVDWAAGVIRRAPAAMTQMSQGRGRTGHVSLHATHELLQRGLTLGAGLRSSQGELRVHGSLRPADSPGRAIVTKDITYGIAENGHSGLVDQMLILALPARDALPGAPRSWYSTEGPVGTFARDLLPWAEQQPTTVARRGAVEIARGLLQAVRTGSPIDLHIETPRVQRGSPGRGVLHASDHRVTLGLAPHDIRAELVVPILSPVATALLQAVPLE